MTLQLRALAEDLSSDPRIYVRWLTTFCDSGYRRSDAAFWLLLTLTHRTNGYILRGEYKLGDKASVTIVGKSF